MAIVRGRWVGVGVWAGRKVVEVCGEGGWGGGGEGGGIFTQL